MSTDDTKFYDIIVVDNELKICELIKFFLSLSKKVGKVVIAENALQANQKLSNQKFDVMIIDQLMPGKTGLELIEQLNRVPKYSKMKYLLISGCLQKEDVISALQLGVKHVLVKPFSHSQLFEKLEVLLGIDKM